MTVGDFESIPIDLSSMFDLEKRNRLIAVVRQLCQISEAEGRDVMNPAHSPLRGHSITARMIGYKSQNEKKHEAQSTFRISKTPGRSIPKFNDNKPQWGFYAHHHLWKISSV